MKRSFISVVARHTHNTIYFYTLTLSHSLSFWVETSKRERERETYNQSGSA